MHINRSPLLALAALVLAACGGDSVTNPPFEPLVVVEAGTFSFQAIGFAHVTDTRDYVWQRPGGTATVEHESSLSAGTTTLTILDPSGAQVYTAPLAATGTVETSMGSPGAWTVRVAVANASGTVSFRLSPAYIGTP